MASLRDKSFLVALASGLARQSRLGIARFIRGSIEVAFSLAGYLLGFFISMAFAMLFLGAWFVPIIVGPEHQAVAETLAAWPSILAQISIFAFWALLASRDYLLLAIKPSGRLDRFHAWISAPMSSLFFHLQNAMIQPTAHPADALIDASRARQSLFLAFSEGFGSIRLPKNCFLIGWQSSLSIMAPLCGMTAYFCSPIFWVPALAALTIGRLLFPKTDPSNPTPANPIARLGHTVSRALEGVAAHGAQARAHAERSEIDLAAKPAPVDPDHASRPTRL